LGDDFDFILGFMDEQDFISEIFEEEEEEDGTMKQLKMTEKKDIVW